VEEENDTERFCNDVAAEVLAPTEEFTRLWGDRLTAEANVSSLTRTFKVSSLVVLRRALDLKKIGREAFLRLYARQQKEFAEAQARKKSSEGGGDFYATLGVHNSKLLTRMIVASALEGRTLYRDAARLLHVQVPTIFAIAEYLRQSG
jgi:Zn-dependent peptidase ImmA (M78 family)